MRTISFFVGALCMFTAIASLYAGIISTDKWSGCIMLAAGCSWAGISAYNLFFAFQQEKVRQ